MKKVLLTTVCRPIGPRHGDAPSVGYELLYGQVTRAQGLFSPRATHVQFSLEYIAHNLDAPATVLQYPSRRELIRELKKGYDYLGVAFIMATFHRMKDIVALARRYAPRTKIVLGGYGTVLGDEELAPYGDFICREEGVAFMRRLLGEPPRPMPYEHPMIVSKLSVFSVPASRTGMVFAGLGCANGCDFCCTSHFFKRKHIRLLPTGKDVYEVLCRYQDEHGVGQFTILDEDFLLNKTRADEFRRCVAEGGRTFSIFAFASIRALSRYTAEDLLSMGIDGLWIGYEGTRSGYAKQQGRQPDELFPELFRNGVTILASMIVGFDYQDREVVREELRGLLRLRPTLSQFLIYGPTPGTPFYERVVSEGRMRPEVVADKERYYRQCTGFRSMVTHPRLSAGEIEALQAGCFERDFQRLGPVLYRSVRVWLSGYQTHRRSPRAALRRKAARFAAEARRAYPLFLAGRLFAPNRRVRTWVAALQRRLHRELGAPSLLERALSVAAVGAAAWTRLSLSIDWFQHPRMPARRFRWSGVWQERMHRLWGELCPDGAAAELRVRLERMAGGFSRVRLEGALDRKTAEQLAGRLAEALRQRTGGWEFHLEGLQYIDRKGLAIFYKAFRRYRRKLRVVPPRASAEGWPDLAALRRFFAIAPSEA